MKYIFRILFLPVTLCGIGLTAFLEYIEDEPDWDYWRDRNKELFKLLRIFPYKNKGV